MSLQILNANDMERSVFGHLSAKIKSDFQIVADHLGEAFTKQANKDNFSIYITDTSRKGLEPFHHFLAWARREEEAGRHPYDWGENKGRLLSVRLTDICYSSYCGMAINSHILCLYFNTQHENFTSCLKDDENNHLLRLIAHETNHAWRSHLLWQASPSTPLNKRELLPFPDTYLGQMIQEGLAMTFEDEVVGHTIVYPRHKEAKRLNDIFDKLATPPKNDNILPYALSPLTPEEHYAFWFGGGVENYPALTAYILGNAFIKGYLASNKSPSGNAMMTSAEAIDLTPQRAYDWWKGIDFKRRVF